MYSLKCALKALWQGLSAVSTLSPGRVCYPMIRALRCQTAMYEESRITDKRRHSSVCKFQILRKILLNSKIQNSQTEQTALYAPHPTLRKGIQSAVSKAPPPSSSPATAAPFRKTHRTSQQQPDNPQPSAPAWKAIRRSRGQ